jgi:hypothetical protein
LRSSTGVGACMEDMVIQEWVVDLEEGSLEDDREAGRRSGRVVQPGSDSDSESKRMPVGYRYFRCRMEFDYVRVRACSLAHTFPRWARCGIMPSQTSLSVSPLMVLRILGVERIYRSVSVSWAFTLIYCTFFSFLQGMLCWKIV